MGSYERDKLIIGNHMINRFIEGGIENIGKNLHIAEAKGLHQAHYYR